MARSDHSDRTKAERIQRLRERLDQAKTYEQLTGGRERLDQAKTYEQLMGVLKGLLDLLADEL